MCGEIMRLKDSKVEVLVPGNPQATTRTVREWVCRECEYFEEAEEAGP